MSTVDLYCRYYRLLVMRQKPRRNNQLDLLLVWLHFSLSCTLMDYKGWSKSSRPDASSDQNKIKIVFASYSSKAQNTTCAIWLLGYKYFVHFTVWTKCLSDGCQDANTRTAHKFLKNFLNDTEVTQQKFISQLIIEDETWIHHFDSESEQQSMQWNEWISQIVISLHCVNPLFSTSTADNRQPLKCTNYL